MFAFLQRKAPALDAGTRYEMAKYIFESMKERLSKGRSGCFATISASGGCIIANPDYRYPNGTAMKEGDVCGGMFTFRIP